MLFVGDGDGTGVGLVATRVPLFHINFLPDLTHVYLIFAIVFVEFTFVHFVPVIVAGLAGKNENTNIALTNEETNANLARNMKARLAFYALKVAGEWSANFLLIRPSRPQRP